MPTAGFKPPNPSKETTANVPLRERGHWDQLLTHFPRICYPFLFCDFCPACYARDITAQGLFAFSLCYFYSGFFTSDEFRLFVVIMSSPSKPSLSAWIIGCVLFKFSTSWFTHTILTACSKVKLKGNDDKGSLFLRLL